MAADNKESSACTVSQALGLAKRGLEEIRLSVVGEVSEFNDRPGYKAAYFTIRDDASALPCQMWRGAYDKSGVALRPGILVQVDGMFSCYPAKGRMQFVVRQLKLAGEGDLRVRVAQLAAKLEAEGLMDPLRKKGLPALPQRIAVITSPRGKAIRDVMRTLRRRYPLGELMVYGVPVEGDKAPQHMIEALAAAQRSDPAPQVILLVRGGGSYEDLMPFNDEGLARAIFACRIPVVTGIGHEPDNSIADMVSDRRCSTPTAAAEAIAPSTEELKGKLKNATNALCGALEQRISGLEHRLQRMQDRPLFNDPGYLLGGAEQELALQEERLNRALPTAMRDNQTALAQLEPALRQALLRNVEGSCRAWDERRASLDRSAKDLLSKQGETVALAAAKLDALSPLKVLSRGFAIATGPGEAGILRSVEGIREGDDVHIRLADGRLDCTVNATEREA